MKVSPMKEELKHQNLASSTGFYLRSSLREARRRKLYFCLAISSTFIVVAATAVSQTLLDYTPLIFLKNAESDTGSIDAQLDYYSSTFAENDGVSTTTVAKNLLFNSTAIEAQIEPIFPGATTARYTFSSPNVMLRPGGICTGTNPCYTATFHLQNTERETILGMATDPELPHAIPNGGVVMTSRYARSIQVNVGDIVYINMMVGELLRDVVVQYNSKQTSASDRLSQTPFSGRRTTIPFKVSAIVDSMSGKFPDGTHDAILTEYGFFFNLLANYMPSLGLEGNANYQRFLQYLRNENPRNYASRMLFNLKDRMTTYRNSNFDIIQEELTLFGSKISNALGVFPYQITLPVFEELTRFQFAGLFMGIVMTIIIVVLFILSTLLIYNLLLVTVETKSFEFGVIRMIGLNKQGIAQLILVQALLFALPGVILGLFLSVPLLKGVGTFLEQMLSASVPIIPSGMAIFWAVLIGIAIPIISSYYPMREALSKNLNLSLDLVHSKTNAVQISIEIGSKVFPWTQITFGVLTVLFGIGIYIILPLSLLSLQLGLLLGLFFLILIGLLVGLTLLSLNFQHLMARLVTFIFFFWTSTSFKSLILKNLLAHKLRNRQTAIMYSLALGFIIFILVALNQQLSSMSYQMLSRRGAYMRLSSTSHLDVAQVENLMTGTLADAVESYTFISHDLVNYVIEEGLYTSVVMTHKGQLYTEKPRIRAISPSTYQTTLNEFLVVNSQDQNTGLDLGQQLYTPRGSQGAIIGTTYKDRLGITDDLDSAIIIKLENGARSRSEELRVIASVESSPGFTFSQLPSVTNQDVLVSFPTFTRLANNVTMSVRDVPVEIVLVKVKGDSDANMARVYNEFNRMKQADSNLRLWDYRDTRKRNESNQNTLSFIFKAVEILVMLLSMFSLVTSMTTNIMDQTKEIAVLRAIGLTRFKINMLYVSEAYVLIVSSAIFGIIIGTVVAWTLSVQMVLFTQLPMVFTFPGIDVLIIFAVAAFSAYVSSYFPARRVTKHQISKIIRLGG